MYMQQIILLIYMEISPFSKNDNIASKKNFNQIMNSFAQKVFKDSVLPNFALCAVSIGGHFLDVEKSGRSCPFPICHVIC